MPHDLAPLLARISDLVHKQADDASRPLLARMEHTLTDGYAHALALEGERIRLERAIGEVVARAEREEKAAALTSLAARHAETERELDRLRSLLAGLWGRADAVRRAVSEPSS